MALWLVALVGPCLGGPCVAVRMLVARPYGEDCSSVPLVDYALSAMVILVASCRSCNAKSKL